MTPKRFFTGLAYTLFFQILSTWLISLIMPHLMIHTGFIAVSMATMGLFCIFLYAAARTLATSKMTHLYIQLIMIAVFLKMLVCLALIIGYKKISEPQDNNFVWPFLIIYISTTVYEVIFMERVGRQPQSS